MSATTNLQFELDLGVKTERERESKNRPAIFTRLYRTNKKVFRAAFCDWADFLFASSPESP